MIWFAHLGAVEANLLPFPIGNSYSKFANSTCVLLKSESARSRRQLRISVGVRLFVELKPPPVAAPVGSQNVPAPVRPSTKFAKLPTLNVSKSDVLPFRLDPESPDVLPVNWRSKLGTVAPGHGMTGPLGFLGSRRVVPSTKVQPRARLRTPVLKALRKPGPLMETWFKS